MKQILSLIAILIASECVAQTNWEKVPLSEKVYIAFPAKPIMANMSSGQKSFILKQADSTANFIVAVTDMEKIMGIDSATLATEMEKEESWDQAKIAFVKSMGANAKLIKDEMIEVKNKKAMKLIVERKNDSGGINTLSVLIFVQGTNSFNIIFNNRGGKADNKLGQQFFESIEINE